MTSNQATERRVLLPRELPAHAPPAGSAVHSFSGLTMGTSWSVKVAAPQWALPPDLNERMQGQLDRVVAQMSHWKPDSDLSRFNRAAAGTWCTLPSAFYTVLSYALGVAKRSDGAFDPTSGALVNAWGFGPRDRFDESTFTAPTAQRVSDLTRITRPRWADIQLDHATQSALQPGGVQLDFSAVAKGYAVDLIANHLREAGLPHALVEVGGELRGTGMKPDQQPWWVELEQPPPPNQAAATPAPVIALHGLSVATSGDYRRYFERDGVRYPHTIDPRTGHPLRNHVASVTVIHQQCMAADALSTALGVMGVGAGLRFAQHHQLAARFMVRQDGGLIEHTSPAFDALLQ